ncbi:BspA family leucine-rich repeat surface protein, partial [Maribacter hydrothermalis]
KTDNPGVSANNQITIPTFPGEVIGINGSTDYSYNYDVDWGDGNIDLGVSGDATHTYDVPGTYTVSIIGEFPQIYFNASGDKDKILSVAQWGNIQLVNMTSAFEGCSNLDVVALDIPSRAIDYKAMFKDCKSLVGNSKFNDWDMHDAFGVAYMFAGAELFNQDISNWSFGTLFNMNGMFEGATSFNQPVSWAYSERTPTMINMFKDATSFDQDLSLMPRHGSDMTGMLVNSGMSNENYDKTLIGWGSRPKESDVVFDAPDNQYCLSEEARQTLIDDYGWTINDAGKSCLADFSNAFVTTWKTDNPGVSGNNQITIPTSSVGSYDYSVDWGDGIIESGFTGDATHTYSNAGTYTVSIIGDFPGIHFNDTGDKEKLRQVIKWGDNTWSRFDGAFKGCTNLDVVATDIPDLSNVSSFTEMFSGCSNLIGNNSFNSWNVSSATTMLGMFHGATKFNQPLGNWNVSNVLETIGMFMESGFNQDVSSWNVSKVERMNSMFRGAIVFNQSLGEWSLNSITNMDGMLDDTDLSIENYDATLIGWKNGAPINGITLGAINLTYCTSEQARQELIAINGWTINDAGKSCSTIACTNDLANEDSFMVLPSGTLVGGVDSAIGTNSDTNGSPCALVVENVDANQPWGRYKISLNLSAQGISAGDELYISVDGKSLSGQARFEINRNDTPNATLARNTFGSDWSKFESTFVIPSGLTTIDLWFFSNYTQQTAGKAIYDNLTVINMSTAATARSIQETKPLNDLTIYPNPANIETTLSFKQPTTVGTIQVFDVTGRLVQTIKGGSIDQKGTPVNVQEMPQGVYFVKTIDVSGVEFQQQMLIQRQ